MRKAIRTLAFLSCIAVAQVSAAMGQTATSQDTVVRKPARFANLGSRKLGEAVTDTAGQRKVWPHMLPIFGQKVTDLGFELPNPYGISQIGAYVRQDLILSNLEVSNDGGNTFQPVDFVEFPGVNAEDLALEAKLDAWLFPFMNVYAIGGYITGNANLTVGIPVDSMLSFLGLDVCSRGGPLQPDFCNEVIALPIEPKYHGYSYGLGTVLAVGWRDFFAAFPITFVWSNLNITESTISTSTMEILVGRIFKLEGGKALELFVGSQYLDASYKVRGSVTLPLSDVDPSLNDVEVDSSLDENNKDKWNFVLGGQYQISAKWDIQGQIGFLGSREQIVLNGVYRW